MDKAKDVISSQDAMFLPTAAATILNGLLYYA